MSQEKTKKVLIVGGGFAGLKAALELSRNSYIEVTLISDKPTFRYNPTLYHTATGGLFKQSSIPLSDILSGGRITFIEGTAVKLNRTTRGVELDGGKVVNYDTLILALGVVTNYFGIKGLAEYSYGIKSTDEVKRFKSHLLGLIKDTKKPDINYLIVGGGPSGIELAGVLPEYLRQIMKKYGVKQKNVNVKLIEAAPRLLPRSKPSISNAVEKRLQKLGVELILGKSVDGETPECLMVAGKEIKSHTVVWTAGTANNPFFKTNNFKLDERGKVIVDDHLLAEEKIYVLGDNAKTAHSGLAQTAVRDGHFAAHDIEAKFHGNQGNAYKPKTPGTVVPVGPGWAAFEWGPIHLTGRLGWIVRQAADWIGFHDLEPWWKASQQWATEFGEEDDSPKTDK